MKRPPSESIMQLRRQLAAELSRSLGPAAQDRIGPKIGVSWPRLCELEHGKVKRCTVEWLITRIHRLDGTVRMEVTLEDAARARWIKRVRAQQAEAASGAAARRAEARGAEAPGE